MRLRNFLKKVWQIKWLRVALVSLLVLTLVGLFLILNFHRRYADVPYKYGVTYSLKAAEDLGINWQEGYLAIVNDLRFDVIRVMSYWDLIEPENDKFSFTDLDWQFKKAAEAGIDVSLAVGYKQPRWPECHEPSWASELDQEQWQEELLEFVEQVVNRYKKHPALVSYQLENEADLRLFGACRWPYSEERLEEEYDLIQSLHPGSSIIQNFSQSRWPLSVPLGEKVGFSAYRQAYFELFNRQQYWSYLYIPSWWHTLRAEVTELLGNETFITELQMEPWGPKPTKQLSDEEQLHYMNSEQIEKNLNFARNTGMKEIHFWGAEWWYWRLVEFNDRTIWNTVKELVD